MKTTQTLTAVKSVPSASSLLDMIEQCLYQTKAEDVVVLDLSGKSDLADYMVVASGSSQRQLKAIADRICRLMDDRGMTTPDVEGVPDCDWVLVDTGDVLVHLFKPETRSHYNLEKMWAADLGAMPH